MESTVAYSFDLAVDPEGSAVLVWETRTSVRGWLIPLDVRAKRLERGNWGPTAIVDLDPHPYLSLNRGMQPQVALDGGGRGRMAWHVNSVGIRSARFDGAWGPPEDFPESLATVYLRVAVSETGTGVVVWTPFEGGVWGAGFEGSGRRDRPRLLSAEVRVDSLVAASATLGPAVAVWSELDRDATLWSAAYDGAWKRIERLHPLSTDAEWPGDLACDDSGDCLLMYLARDASQVMTLASEWFRPGSGWSGPDTLSRSAEALYEAKVGLDAQGGALAVWREFGQGTSRVVAATLDPRTGWSPALTLAEPSQGPYAYVDAAVDREGNGIAVWSRGLSPLSTVWAARYRPGHGWGEPSPLQSDMSSADRPRIAMDSTGNALVVWSQGAGLWFSRFVRDPRR